MQNRTKSLIEELSKVVPAKDKDLFIQGQASNLLSSINYLMEMISNNFSEDESEDLKKRFLVAAKNNDPDKFNRKLTELRNRKMKNKGDQK